MTGKQIQQILFLGGPLFCAYLVMLVTSLAMLPSRRRPAVLVLIATTLLISISLGEMWMVSFLNDLTRNSPGAQSSADTYYALGQFAASVLRATSLLLLLVAAFVARSNRPETSGFAVVPAIDQPAERKLADRTR